MVRENDNYDNDIFNKTSALVLLINTSYISNRKILCKKY